jgi:hypothetical protein
MKKKLSHLLAATGLLSLILLALFLSLPFFIDIYLLPKLAKEVPFTVTEMSISRITPWKIRGTLSLRDDRGQKISLPKFELHYTAASLLNKEFDLLLLDSLSLHLLLPVDLNSDKKASPARPSLPLLPIAVKKIIVQDSTITLQPGRSGLKKSSYRVDGSIELSFSDTDKKQKRPVSVAATLAVRGDAVAGIEIKGQLSEKLQQFKARIQLADLSELTDVTSLIAGKQLKGFTGTADIEADITLDRLTILRDYRAEVHLKGARVIGPGLSFATNRDGEITFALNGDTQQAKFSLSGIDIVQPEQAELTLSGSVDFQNQQLFASTSIKSERSAQPIQLEVEAAREQTSLRLNYSLVSEKLQITEAVSSRSLKLTGSALMAGDNTSGEINLQIAAITDRKHHLSAADIKGQLPFFLPGTESSQENKSGSPVPKPKKGYLKINSLSYKNVPSASLRATLVQQGSGVDLDAVIITPFVKEAKLACNGNIQAEPLLKLSCDLPASAFSSSDFPSYLPLPKTLALSGQFKARGNIFYAGDRLSGDMTAELSQAELQQGETTLSGIKIQLHMPDITRTESDPGQLATIERLQFGTLLMSDAKIFFRLQDQQTLFIEKLRLHWCGGKVEAGSMTLSPAMHNLETTLYCDRLGFSELLGQLGISGTEGDGSLNGRLPLDISNKGIQFDDGFLFSTPGNSGIVHFNNTGQLKQSMPAMEGSPYLDYTMKALENFSYNWTRLTFNSLDDELLLAMQLDGKPARPLPFAYKSGQIVATDSGPGLQHPIRIDVNFRLPLQELFSFGTALQSFMEKQ